MNNSTMGDKEMMLDSLSTQKFVTGNYNTSANECANPQLRNEMMSILKEEHDIQSELFTEISNRGWYQIKQAPPNEVSTAKQKFMSGS